MDEMVVNESVGWAVELGSVCGTPPISTTVFIRGPANIFAFAHLPRNTV